MKHTICPACGVPLANLEGITRRRDKSHSATYRVRLRINGKRQHVGDFDSLSPAIAARDKAVSKAKLADAIAALTTTPE